MASSYFLGANGADGFVSLYGGFCRAPGDYLRIVKGGPGTGKSTFMRAIGREAERRGETVEYVLCSGDPSSVDGVYLPGRRLGWVDGTAPHTAEPGVFGADSDYVNLGQFCSTPLPAPDAERAAAITEAYRAEYARAYALLAAAERLLIALSPKAPGAKALQRVDALVSQLVESELSDCAPSGGSSKRFLGEISCEGLLRDWSSLELCKLVYELEDGCGLAGALLERLRDRAAELGVGFVECLSPFDCRSVDALIFPAASLAFIRGAGLCPGARRLRLDRLCGSLDEVKAMRRELRAARRERDRCVEAACGVLRGAKALHDALETVYRPYMDHLALDAFTAAELARVFC